MKLFLMVAGMLFGVCSLQGMDFPYAPNPGPNVGLDLVLRRYAATLPRIVYSEDCSLEIIICNFLRAFQSLPAQSGIDALMGKILRCIQVNEPIKLLMLGFPLKSLNCETKVLTPQFDFADFIGLFTLNYLCEEITRAYPSGAVVTICTHEAYMDDVNACTQRLAEFNLFPKKPMNGYQESLTRLLRSRRFPCIRIGKIDSIKEHYQACKEAYRAFRADLVVDEAELRALKAFVQGELECREFLSYVPTVKKRGELAKFVAQEIYHGTRVMRTLLAACVPDYENYIRLSVRPDITGDISKKLGISLVYGSQGTPWHGVCAISEFGLSLKRLEECQSTRCYEEKRFEVAGLDLVYLGEKS